MNWLRARMDAADPSIRSFGALAKLCVSHPEWPDDARIQTRSLATLFSKFDKGDQLEWLSERPDELHVLAAVLGCTEEELRSGVGERATSRVSHLFRLSETRYFRDLDLIEEELPPGIPIGADEPRLWNRSVWISNSSAAAQLIEAFIDARKRAYLWKASERSARTIPMRGPTLLVVEEHRGAPLPSKPELLAKLNARQSDDFLLLVVTESRERWAPMITEARLHKLESDSVESFVGPLSGWLESRRSDDSPFQAELAERWVRQIPNFGKLNWDQTLGLLSLHDELPPRKIANLSRAQAARAFVDERLSQVTGRWKLPRQQRERAFNLLEDVVSLKLSQGAPLSRLPLEEWTEAFAECLGNWAELDSDLVDRALSQAPAERRTRESLRKSLQAESIRSYHFFQSFLASGLLSEDRDVSTLYSLSPSHLRSSLVKAGLERIARRGPAHYGDALIRFGERLSENASALYFETESGVDRLAQHLEELIDAFDPLKPQSARVLEEFCLRHLSPIFGLTRSGGRAPAPDAFLDEPLLRSLLKLLDTHLQPSASLVEPLFLTESSRLAFQLIFEILAAPFRPRETSTQEQAALHFITLLERGYFTLQSTGLKQVSVLHADFPLSLNEWLAKEEPRVIFQRLQLSGLSVALANCSPNARNIQSEDAGHGLACRWFEENLLEEVDWLTLFERDEELVSFVEYLSPASLSRINDDAEFIPWGKINLQTRLRYARHLDTLPLALISSLPSPSQHELLSNFTQRDEGSLVENSKNAALALQYEFFTFLWAQLLASATEGASLSPKQASRLLASAASHEPYSFFERTLPALTRLQDSPPETLLLCKEALLPWIQFDENGEVFRAFREVQRVLAPTIRA